MLAHLAPAVAPPPTLWHRIEERLGEGRAPTTAGELRTVIRLSPALEDGPAAQERASCSTINPGTGPADATPPASAAKGSPPTNAFHRKVTSLIRPELRRRFSAQRVVALVAAAVVVIGGAGITLLRGSNQPGSERSPEQQGGRQAEITYGAIASGPHTVVTLQPTAQAQGASGEILVAPDGTVAVAIHGLAAPRAGTYTMWLADDGQTRSLGDFRPDASGEVQMATAGTAGHNPKLVVTLESRPGRTSPGGPPVLST